MGTASPLDAANRDVDALVGPDYFARGLGSADGKGPEGRRSEGGLLDEVSAALTHGDGSPAGMVEWIV